MSIREMWSDLRSEPLETLTRWQDARFPWLLMAGVGLFMVLLAHSVFQVWLFMRPCEQCVYIRFAFFCIVFGGVVGAINPKVVALKLVGYGLAFWGAIQGVGYGLKLDRIHKAVHSDNPFGVQGCSTDPKFPLGLPLDRWSAEWFKPTGDCGYDNPIVPDGTVLTGLRKWFVDFYSDGWYLWPKAHFLTMAQACLITFGVILLILAVAALAWLIVSIRAKTPSLSSTATQH